MSRRTIQLHEPRPMLLDAQEHLDGPATKLLALERLLNLSGWAVIDGRDRLGDTNNDGVSKVEIEQEGDVLLGLSRLLRDVREEFQALRDARFERDEENKPQPAPTPKPAVGGAR